MENMTVDKIGCEEAISHAQDVGREYCMAKKYKTDAAINTCVPWITKTEGVCVSAEVKTGVCQSYHGT